MTDQTPPTGDDDDTDQALGPGDQGARSGPAPSAEMSAPPAGPGEGLGDRPDETRDTTRGPDPVARRGATPGVCACCGNPLPPPTREARKPRRYCRPGEGGLEDRHGVTCTEFGPIKEKYEKVLGREAVPAAHLLRLGEQLDAAQRLLGPASPVAQHLAGLAGTLTGVGERLDGTVADTLADNTRLTLEAREALGREAAAITERNAADELAQEEVLARQRAERDRDTRVRAATDRAAAAEAAQHAAERIQGGLEAERDLYKERAERAEESLRRLGDTLAEAQATNAALTATVGSLRAQLASDTERATAELDRVRAESTRTLRDLRESTELAVAQARTDFAEQLAAAATATNAEIGRLSVEHTEALRRLDRERAAELADHQRAASDAQHHLQRQLDTLRAGLRQLVRAGVRGAEADPGEQARVPREALADLLAEVGDDRRFTAAPPPPHGTPPDDAT